MAVDTVSLKAMVWSRRFAIRCRNRETGDRDAAKGHSSMASKWYYKEMGEEFGPLSTGELRHLAERGVVTTETPVRQSKQSPWIPAGRIEGLLTLSHARTVQNSSAMSTPMAKQPASPQPLVEDAPASQKAKRDTRPSPPPPRTSSKQEAGAAAAPHLEQSMTKSQANIIIALLLIGLGFPLFGAIRPTQRWEYRIESPSDISFSDSMQALGDEGWELVFARRATSSFGGASYEMIFKRPK
ncbi:hypothetical protein Mal4_35340 [Maioricimonas rarisocia]|uniref:GYF domain-containing protein n=1 Tax=Maioricimonas rarisocia TaxID=2528026 RepID=A0A517Z9N9_9PLAN|nr:DUF4339 domain-containing protein [Maioricimonas rarisocia]QDU39197.1 hypothetical protein Mal4_35340 [Maioricimonas rarisocia]